jgi:hypothetical protein
LLRRQIDGATDNLSKDSQQAGDEHKPNDSKLFASSVTIDDSPVSLVDYEDLALSIDPEKLYDFVSRVQPILLNQCGSCHSHTSEQEWQMLTPSRGVRTSARMARENYVATVPYVDRSAPQASELLRYALTAHGGGPIPLGPRHAIAIETLKRWLQSVAEHQPSSSSLTRSLSSDPIHSREPSTGIEDATDSGFAAAAPDTTSLKPSLSEQGGNEPRLQRLPQVENPFDPELFNRKFHRDPPIAEP